MSPQAIGDLKPTNQHEDKDEGDVVKEISPLSSQNSFVQKQNAGPWLNQILPLLKLAQ